jgi:hypothetical protein
MRSFVRPRIWFVGLLVVASGCGKSELVNGTGRLTYKGDPVPCTWVVFVPQEEGKRPSTGLTDTDGKFKLFFTRQDTGVLRGKHSVYLRYRSEVEEVADGPRATTAMKQAIARHEDPTTSGLRYEVTTEGQHFEISLN